MLFLNVLYNIVIRALGIFMRRTKATHNWCDWEYVCTYNLLLFPLSPCLCFSFLFFIFLLYFSFFFVKRAFVSLCAGACHPRSHFEHGLRICAVFSPNPMCVCIVRIACCCLLIPLLLLFPIHSKKHIFQPLHSVKCWNGKMNWWERY